MSKFKLLLIALLLAGSSFGQSTKIIGTVFGEEKEVIPGATIMLIGARDSILKSYSITNKEGVFTLSGIKKGSYVLKASFFGLLPYETNVEVSQVETNIELGSLQMESKVLDKVLVDGHYIPIQMKGDTIEYDARAFETKEHDMVEDLLEQLPGVEIEDDGTIKVQGREVEQILVDGEAFFGNDPTIATKNLPANAVEKVQVFDKKSDMAEFTGIDDGSESTTINLKLKASHKKGSFGNIEAGIGVDQPYQDALRYQAKGNVHYFQQKFQFSIIGMSNNINETGFSFSDYMNFMGGAQNLVKRSGSGFQSSGLPTSDGASDNGFLSTHAAGINLNYKPSKQMTITASVFLNSFDKTYDKELKRLTYFSDSTLKTNEGLSQASNTLNNRGDLKFEQKFDSTHFLNVNLSGSWSDATYSNANLIENFNREDQIASAFTTDLGQNEFSYDFSGSAEYRKKFVKPGRFTGGELSISGTNNDINTSLDYINTLYLNAIGSDFYTNQDQLMKSSTGKYSGSWMWSEPITKNQLLQAEYTYNHNTEGRNKEVFDNVLEVQQLNDFLSAKGDYLRFSHDAELKHKFLSEGFNTTFGVDYKYLNLSGDSIFTAPKDFQYILPSARIEWDATKNGYLRLSYNSSVTSPSLDQLQPLPDNTNPSEIVLGNSDLQPEYNHNVQFRFMNFNQFNFTFFMANIGGIYVKNNITYSQNVNQFFVKEITPENLGDEKSLNAFLIVGSSLYPIKTKFNISGNASMSNGLVNLNGMGDQYTSYLFQPKITVENIGKKVFNLRGGFGYTYSVNQYKENESFNNNYSNWNYYGDFTVNLKDRWELNTGISHYFYPDFETNNQLVLWDARIAVNLLKSKKLQVYISGTDLLNQNTGINQYYLQNIYEQEVTQTLARYFMVGLKYSFQKLGTTKNP